MHSCLQRLNNGHAVRRHRYTLEVCDMIYAYRTRWVHQAGEAVLIDQLSDLAMLVDDALNDASARLLVTSMLHRKPA